MTDPTELHLLRSIVAHPHEDTPRLAYADWLDEHAGKVSCPLCRGGQGADPTGLTRCVQCHGTGTVSDGRAERAELIRAQVELARLAVAPLCRHLPDSSTAMCTVRGCYDSRTKWALRKQDMQARERELLAAHAREWSRVPCPQCECKGGWEDAVAYYRCGHCKGTGDAMQREGCTPHFRRGFVERVEVPALSWVCERVAATCEPCEGTGHDGTNEYHSVGVGACQRCEGMGTRTEWRVTPWAIGVASTHPVTEWGIGDREPLEVYPGVWSWSRGYPDTASHALPEPLYLAIRPGDHLRINFDTREAALSALATAAADWVRAKVREAWAKEVRP